MGNINSYSELKNEIQRLETEQVLKGRMLKEELYITIEKLKPVNILKRSIEDMALSPFLIENIIGNAVGLVSGFLSKKIVIGTSANIFRKLIGSLVQISVTNSVKNHPETIKSVGQFIVQFFKKTIK
jgi:hypothetical protein